MRLLTCLLLVFLGYRLCAGEPKICLAMMVHNDAPVIEECLKSAGPLVDYLSIFDLGSSDGTVELIEAFMQEHQIPGTIQRFKSAPEDKTLLVLTSQYLLKKNGFPLEESYLLILEPNLKVECSGFSKNVLTEDGYFVLEKDQLSFCHYNLCLLKANYLWQNEKLYSSWFCDEALVYSKLRSLVLSDMDQPSYKEEKMHTKVSALTAALFLEPSNPHYQFLLAQGYKNLKHYDEAIKWFSARIQLGEERDEVWFSKYMMGECYEAQGDWTEALYWYLEAFQSNPNRPDSLKNIALHYRNRGENELAYIFAKHGTRIPLTSNHYLFHLPPFSGYEFEEELSIASYYTRFREEGYLASSDLTLKKNTPWNIKYQAYKNLVFYAQNLPARFQQIEINTPIIQPGYPDRYHPMNPSIIKTEKGYKMICRSVNYTQSGAKNYQTVDETGIYRTKNFLVELDQQFNIISQKEIVENLNRTRYPGFNVQGLEDCRLFEWNGSDWFSCTTADTQMGNRQISLCKLSDNGRVETLTPLEGPDPNRCEKNWLPFIKDGELLMVYSSSPFTLYKPDIKTGKHETVLQYDPPNDFSQFRGSCSPIPFDHGYLMLVHEVTYLQDYNRCYYHRLLFLNKDFQALKASAPFVFSHFGVEFCLGMTLDHSEKELIFSVGIEDNEAYLFFVDLETVRDLLHALPPNVDPLF